MIEIHLYKNNNIIYKYIISGHTDEILCNTISVLAQHTLFAIIDNKDDKSNVGYTINEDKGFLCVNIKNITNTDIILTNAMERSLSKLQKEYNDKIKIKQISIEGDV